MEIRVIRNSSSLKHRNSRFFRLNIYEGACMSTTIHQTKSYLYLADSNNLIYFLNKLFCSGEGVAFAYVQELKPSLGGAINGDLVADAQIEVHDGEALWPV